MDLQEAQSLLDKAESFYNNKCLDEAIKLLLQINNCSNEVLGIYIKAQLNLGLCYILKKEFHNAEIFYRKVKKEHSHSQYSKAQYNLGVVLHEQGKYKQAVIAYKRVNSEDNPESYALAQWNLYCLLDDKNYLTNINLDHNLQIYAEAQYKLGELESFLEEKKAFWENIPKQSEQYRKENYQINIVKSVVNLEENNFKNELYKIFEIVNKILKILFINNKYEQIIAHYTNLTVSKLLLDKIENEENFQPVSKLRLNTINLMNDPEEGQLINKLLCVDSKITTQDSAFIACFTLHHDSLNQFRLYAKEDQQEASGLSLVLDRDFFAKEHNASRIYEKEILLNQDKTQNAENTLAAMPLYRCIYFDPTSGLIKVAQREKWSFWREFKLEGKHRWYDENVNAKQNWHEYIHGTDDQEGIKNIEERVKQGLEELSKLVEAENLDDMNSKEQELLAEILLPLRYLMKHMAFKEEQECRIVYVTKMENPLVKYDKEIKRIYIDYEPSVMEHLEKIYLAPKAKDEKTFMEYLCAHGQNVRQHKVTKESNGRVQVKISQNPFR